MGNAYFKAYVTFYESMSHAVFYYKNVVVLGASAFNLRSLGVSREAFAFPLTSVVYFDHFLLTYTF